MMIQYQFFPRSIAIDSQNQMIVDCFKAVEQQIQSPENKLKSNEVLAIVRPYLTELKMKVESGRRRSERINVPVLFGCNNTPDKSFSADAISEDGKIVLEIEAGRAVDNYQFLKDIFQASMMFDVEYLVLAVKNKYRSQDDFQTIYTFLETMYINNRIKLPLKGILLIGY